MCVYIIMDPDSGNSPYDENYSVLWFIKLSLDDEHATSLPQNMNECFAWNVYWKQSKSPPLHVVERCKYILSAFNADVLRWLDNKKRIKKITLSSSDPRQMKETMTAAMSHNSLKLLHVTRDRFCLFFSLFFVEWVLLFNLGHCDSYTFLYENC